MKLGVMWYMQQQQRLSKYRLTTTKDRSRFIRFMSCRSCIPQPQQRRTLATTTTATSTDSFLRGHDRPINNSAIDTMTPIERIRFTIDALRSQGKLPALTENMIQQLHILDERFRRIEQIEPNYGSPTRGIITTQQIISEEKLEKRATKEVANIYLNNWIYTRYALQLGYDKLTHVPSSIVADTLIRWNTTIRFYKYKNPKNILKELFRYGQSAMQMRYIQKDIKQQQQEQQSKSTTPNIEEEEDPRVWDPTLFGHKYVGKHISHRPSKWGRRKK